ncbi:MAG: exodeoxyribonuclease V subunit beta [Burkholderiaceae bacterium]
MTTQSLGVTMPLKGWRLIEASAGTGKTYTLELLYLRLLLGRTQGLEGTDVTGDIKSQAQGPAFTIDQILVMTYTEAATQELRRRLGQRIEAALAQGQDPDLGALTDNDKERLGQASLLLDQASIKTIHGWCAQMLTDHALLTGHPLNQELVPNNDEQLRQAVLDYWRSHYLSLDTQSIGLVRQAFASPSAMLKAVNNRLGLQQDSQALPAVTVILDQWRAQRAKVIDEQREWLRQQLPDLQAFLSHARKEKLFKASSLNSTNEAKYLAALSDWAQLDGIDPPMPGGLSKTARQRLTSPGMRDIWNDPASYPATPFLDGFPVFWKTLEQLPTVRSALLSHALAVVSQNLQQSQSRAGQCGFDDLLRRLAQGLQASTGELLASRIRQRFPVALVDEFQDTDPLQFLILESIYPLHRQDQWQTLILVGDPKQAIYSFRGADVETYIRAREQTAHNHRHKLETNYRSQPGLVAAVNAIFQAPSGARTGYFDFLCAKESKPKTSLLLNGQAPMPMQFFVVEEAAEKARSKQVLNELAEQASRQIGTLLQSGPVIQDERELSAEGRPRSRDLKPSDIAVLVNSRRQAGLIKQALQRLRLASVYLSEADSVFESQAAQLLRLLLNACLEAPRPRPLRAALAHPIFGLSSEALQSLVNDDQRFSQWTEAFVQFHRVWTSKGVLACGRAMIHTLGLDPFLTASGSDERLERPERTVTDLCHLLELLQEASLEVSGPRALMHWLDTMVTRDAGVTRPQDNRLLRMESDHDRIKIVTVHKSKGLQYPVVVLPFGLHASVQSHDQTVLERDANGERRLVTQPSEEQKELARQEQYEEDLRKLYVAMTRAEHLCLVGLGPMHQYKSSALYKLLGVGEEMAGDTSLLDLAKAFAQQHARQVAMASAPSLSKVIGSRIEGKAPNAPAAGPRVFHANSLEFWGFTSYSGLLKFGKQANDERFVKRASATIAAESAQEDQALEESGLADSVGVLEKAGVTSARALSAEGDQNAMAVWSGLGSGNALGTDIHRLLDAAARRGFAEVAGFGAEEMLSFVQSQGFSVKQQQPFASWLASSLSLPLFSTHQCSMLGFVSSPSLATLRVYVPEMEFWLPAERLDLKALDHWLHQNCLQGLSAQPNRFTISRPALTHQHFQGMVKGFIDLCFEHEGRYFISDYKSNWLGHEADSYRGQGLMQSIAEHRYDLQYSLYCLALHRHLRARLQAHYDPQKHLGGALYLFLRGMTHPDEGRYFQAFTPLQLSELEQLLNLREDR